MFASCALHGGKDDVLIDVPKPPTVEAVEFQTLRHEMLLLCFPISKLDKIKSKPRRNGNSRSANPPELLLKHRTPQIRISCWR